MRAGQARAYHDCMSFLDRFRKPQQPEERTVQPSHELQAVVTERLFSGKMVDGVVEHRTYRAVDEDHFVGENHEYHRDAEFASQARWKLSLHEPLPQGLPSLARLLSDAHAQLGVKGQYKLSSSGHGDGIYYLVQTLSHPGDDALEHREALETHSERLFGALDRVIARELYIHNEVAQRQSELRSQFSDLQSPIPGFDESSGPAQDLGGH
jgi:hypothetical protein